MRQLTFLDWVVGDPTCEEIGIIVQGATSMTDVTAKALPSVATAATSTILTVVATLTTAVAILTGAASITEEASTTEGALIIVEVVSITTTKGVASNQVVSNSLAASSNSSNGVNITSNSSNIRVTVPNLDKGTARLLLATSHKQTTTMRLQVLKLVGRRSSKFGPSSGNSTTPNRRPRLHNASRTKRIPSNSSEGKGKMHWATKEVFIVVRSSCHMDPLISYCFFVHLA